MPGYYFFVFLVETGFHHIGLAGLELLISRDPPILASQNAGITGVSHCTQPPFVLIVLLHISRSALLIVAEFLRDFHSQLVDNFAA